MPWVPGKNFQQDNLGMLSEDESLALMKRVYRNGLVLHDCFKTLARGAMLGEPWFEEFLRYAKEQKQNKSKPVQTTPNTIWELLHNRNPFKEETVENNETSDTDGQGLGEEMGVEGTTSGTT